VDAIGEQGDIAALILTYFAPNYDHVVGGQSKRLSRVDRQDAAGFVDNLHKHRAFGAFHCAAVTGAKLAITRVRSFGDD
jgi:hypothetical protein